jgi:hypothetical protein
MIKFISLKIDDKKRFHQTVKRVCGWCKQTGVDESNGLEELC